jgi:hypothetical protein
MRRLPQRGQVVASAAWALTTQLAPATSKAARVDILDIMEVLGI